MLLSKVMVLKRSGYRAIIPVRNGCDFGGSGGGDGSIESLAFDNAEESSKVKDGPGARRR